MIIIIIPLSLRITTEKFYQIMTIIYFVAVFISLKENQRNPQYSYYFQNTVTMVTINLHLFFILVVLNHTVNAHLYFM